MFISLVRHPVIAVFMLRKLSWHSVTMVRTIRFNLLFVFCITWYILSRFGGTSMNSFQWASQKSVNTTESTTDKNDTNPVFCKHLQSWLYADTAWQEPGLAFVVLLIMLGFDILYIGRWDANCLTNVCQGLEEPLVWGASWWHFWTSSGGFLFSNWNKRPLHRAGHHDNLPAPEWSHSASRTEIRILQGHRKSSYWHSPPWHILHNSFTSWKVGITF